MISRILSACFAVAVAATPVLAGVEPFGEGFDGWKFTQEDTKDGILCRAILGPNIIARLTNGGMYVSMPAGRVPAGAYPETHLDIGGMSEPVDAKSDGKRFWLNSDEGFLNQLAKARGYYWRTGPIKGQFVDGRVTFNASTGKALKELQNCAKANGGGTRPVAKAPAAPPPASAPPEERQYARLGQWRIMAISQNNRFVFCSADTDNTRVALRIGTDGRTWQVGNPYYDKGPVRGQWGFDGWEDQAMFKTDGDGWAVMDASQHMLDSFRHFDSFSIQLDRGPQRWNIKGASAALDKALECARGSGKLHAANGGKADRPLADATPPGGGPDWIDGTAGTPIDRRAFSVGTMPDGLPVYVCIATYNGGLHPGMTGIWINGCKTGFAGKEVTIEDYSLLVRGGRWIRAANGQVPGDALRGGAEANGAALFICRALYNGGMYAGKVRPGFSGCNIADLGKERVVNTYEVLAR